MARKAGLLAIFMAIGMFFMAGAITAWLTAMVKSWLGLDDSGRHAYILAGISSLVGFAYRFLVGRLGRKGLKKLIMGRCHMSRLIAMALIAMIVMAPMSHAASLLPPEAPWAIAVSFNDMQWMLYTWQVNTSLTVSSTKQRVMLWLNMSLNITANGELMSLSPGWHNITFTMQLVLAYEGHVNNMTIWRQVTIRYVVEQSHEEPQAPGTEASWLKYWRAFVSALAATIIGLRAGMDMKETRLKVKRRKLLKAKAMDLADLAKTLEGHEESDTHEG